ADSPAANATPSAVVPPAPTGVTATASPGQVSLNWNASPGATSYNVKRGTASGAETTIKNVAGTSFTDAVTGGVTYFYEISAVNGIGEGPNSSEVSATPGFLGTGTGLTGYYFNEQTVINNIPFFTTQPVAVRVDPVINFDFDGQPGQRPAGFNHDNEEVF